MYIAAEVFWPQTFGGWLATLVAIVIIASGVAGIVKFMQHITLVTITDQLDTIRREQSKNTATILTAMSRVEALEITINNGLTHKTQETSNEVAKLRDGQAEIKVDIAEIVGLLKGKDI